MRMPLLGQLEASRGRGSKEKTRRAKTGYDRLHDGVTMPVAAHSAVGTAGWSRSQAKVEESLAAVELAVEGLTGRGEVDTRGRVGSERLPVRFRWPGTPRAGGCPR